MQFSQFLLAATSLFAMASAGPVVLPKDVTLPARSIEVRQAALIKAAFDDIEAKTIILRDAFAAADGTDPAVIDDVRAKNTDLLASVASAKAIAAASPVVSLTDVLGLTATINRLQTTLDASLVVVKGKKAQTVQLGFRVEVHDTLVIDQAAVNDFGAVLLTKVPTSAQALAKTFLANFNASFQSAVDFYATD